MPRIKFTDADMEKYCLIKSGYSEPCLICGNDTIYVDNIYEGRVCGKECLKSWHKPRKEETQCQE